MSLAHALSFNGLPVPYTAYWSDEDELFIGDDPSVPGMLAICQKSAPGSGRPRFRPHFMRQRAVIKNGLCDLCGKTLANRTKVSLSHARSSSIGATPLDVLQVEPLLHVECAAISMRHCPSLRRDTKGGTLMVRQVFAYAVQIAICKPEAITHYVPGYVPPLGSTVAGHLKVQLTKWRDRDAAWLAGKVCPHTQKGTP